MQTGMLLDTTFRHLRSQSQVPLSWRRRGGVMSHNQGDNTMTERIAPLDEAKIRLRTVVRQKQRRYSPIEWVGLEDVALVLDAIETTEARITEVRAEGYTAGSHAHRALALSAIFLADTFDKDDDPDVEIRAMRDEWVRDARADAWDEGHAAGRDYQGDGWNSDVHDPADDNPYRARKEVTE